MRILISVILISSLFCPVRSQSLNYRDIFADSWEKASSYEKDNRNWMEPILIRNNIPYSLAIAVIFPELVRYSAIRDKMEITLLKALYINLGDDYANFSIGRFQMKPSFAETIRELNTSSMENQSGIRYKKKSEYGNISEYRESIVSDLENPETQFNYLVTFIRICEKRFKTHRKTEDERIKFLATAYNYGINKNADQIEKMIDKKFFNTKLFKTENYSYADVSFYWYNEFLSQK